MKYVIIGGDAAGMSAAMQIVRGSTGNEIITLEKGDTYSYGQCGLPYAISGKIDTTDRLIARTPETFRSRYGIDAKTKHVVTNVNPDKKEVVGTNLNTNEQFIYEYDRLLIATGADPVMPKWEGIDLPGVHTLKTIPDADSIIGSLADVKMVTIIGGGYIGLEMAESFRQLNKNVTIIERGTQLAKIFDPDLAPLIHEAAETNGINLVFNEQVQQFTGRQRVEAVVTDQGEYPTDLVLVAVGVKPNVSFMVDSGIAVGKKGAILVNPHMETSLSDIYAAGDCATQFHRIKERDDYIPLGTHANKQGQIAGMNMINLPKAFKGIVGTSILKFFHLALGRTGLSEREATDLHIPYKTVTIQTTDIAGYYPGDEKLTVKLLYKHNTRKLLGGQVIGAAGVDKRVDVLSTALFNEMTIDDLLDLDLAYAPPFNGVWDPIQQAARKTL